MDVEKEEWSLCRLCSKETAEKGNDLFHESNIFLHQQIKEIVGITIENEVELPRKFCMKCQNDLTQAYEFRQRLIHAHKYFKNYMKNLKNGVKNETETAFPQNFDTIFISNQVEVDLMESNSMSDGFGASDNEILKDLSGFNSEIEVKIEPQVESTKRIKKSKFIKYKRKKKPKAPKPEKTDKAFICEQCGGSFKTMKFLEIHSIRHEEKKFECEICGAKFFLPTELKRHQISHTGGKQVSCRFCDTKFLNKSNRNRHEKSQHLKLRPFPCTLCGKAFANTHLRKNHMVVHTKERAFDCELCKKSFLRKNHLVTHYKSTAHKKNEIDNENLKTCSFA